MKAAQLAAGAILVGGVILGALALAVGLYVTIAAVICGAIVTAVVGTEFLAACLGDRLARGLARLRGAR